MLDFLVYHYITPLYRLLTSLYLGPPAWQNPGSVQLDTPDKNNGASCCHSIYGPESPVGSQHCPLHFPRWFTFPHSEITTLHLVSQISNTSPLPHSELKALLLISLRKIKVSQELLLFCPPCLPSYLPLCLDSAFPPVSRM